MRYAINSIGELVKDPIPNNFHALAFRREMANALSITSKKIELKKLSGEEHHLVYFYKESINATDLIIKKYNDYFSGMYSPKDDSNEKNDIMSICPSQEKNKIVWWYLRANIVTLTSNVADGQILDISYSDMLYNEYAAQIGSYDIKKAFEQASSNQLAFDSFVTSYMTKHNTLSRDMQSNYKSSVVESLYNQDYEGRVYPIYQAIKETFRKSYTQYYSVHYKGSEIIFSGGGKKLHCRGRFPQCAEVRLPAHEILHRTIQRGTHRQTP